MWMELISGQSCHSYAQPQDKFERGQSVLHATETVRHGNEMLRQLNAAIASSSGSIKIQNPAPLPDPMPQAL
jgi:hypothetical protein